MASSSGRRSASSEPSKRGKPVHISSSERDRNRASSERTQVSRSTAAGRAPSARGHRPQAAPKSREGDGVATAKRSERERRLADQRRRGQYRIAGIVVAVVVLIGVVVGIYRSPLFSIKRVEVVGTERMSREDVVRVAAVPADATLIRFPADVVTANVAKDPRVESVSVSRVFPDAMRIRIVERRAIAVVDDGARTWLIDSHGFVIAQGSGAATGSAAPGLLAGSMPLIRDVKGLDLKAGRKTASEPLLNAVAVLRSISAELRTQVRAVSAPEIDATTLYTADKVEIVFGDAAGAVKKDAIVRKILLDQHGRVVSIDARTTDRPTWRGLGK